MASGIYNRFKANLMNKMVDLEADVINVALYNVSHSFTDSDTDYTVTNEITGTGYVAGGAVLNGKAVTEAATTKWDGTDRDWTGATFSAFHAVIYDTSVTNDLIASIDFGGEQQVTSGTFTIQWHANGIITLA